MAVHIRVPESMSAHEAAVFVRNALNREWQFSHPWPTPKWNVTVYQTFEAGLNTEHRKVRS